MLRMQRHSRFRYSGISNRTGLEPGRQSLRPLATQVLRIPVRLMYLIAQRPPEEEGDAPAKSDGDKKKGHPNQSPEGDDDWLPEKEAYFEMLPNGKRAKEIPDIAKYL